MKPDRQTGKRLFHFGGHGPRHYDKLAQLTGKRMFCNVPDNRLSVDQRQQLIMVPHARGITRCQQYAAVNGLAGLFRVRMTTWLRPTVNLLQQASNAHGHDVCARNFDPCKQALQNPVKPVLLRTARAPRRSDYRRPIQLPQHQQVPWINRHPEVDDVSPSRCYGSRNNITLINHRRSPEHNNQVSFPNLIPLERICECVFLVRHTNLR